MDLEAAFEKFDDEFLQFSNISQPRHARPDIAAFILLDKLVPGTVGMIAAAEHDEIYLDVDPEKLAEVATEADILELVRCGVRFSDDGLCMFV